MAWSRICIAAFAASLLWMQCAAAQTAFPARPIRMLVPFSPGGASDTAARVVSQHMGPRLAQQIVIENRPGVPEVAQSFANIGAEVMSGGPAEFATLVKAELARYAKVVQDANVRFN